MKDLWPPKAWGKAQGVELPSSSQIIKYYQKNWKIMQKNSQDIPLLKKKSFIHAKQ